MAWVDELSRLKSGVRTALGQTVSYDSEAGNTTTSLSAVIKSGDEFEKTSIGAQVELFVRLADLPSAPAKYDQAVFDAKRYQVSEVILDGGGGAKLLLRFLEDVP